jgi:hypothetical protein
MHFWPALQAFARYEPPRPRPDSAPSAWSDLAAGNHEVKLDINNTPSPGSTYYVNET